MKIYNEKENSEKKAAMKMAASENVTNSVTAETAGIIAGEESRYKHFQNLINAAREKAVKRAELRAILTVVNRYESTARAHFGKSAYNVARSYKNAESITIYGKTFPLDCLGRNDKNAAAAVCVLVDSFFSSLDLLKESEERRKAASEKKTADAFALVAAQLGVSIERLKALQAQK